MLLFSNPTFCIVPPLYPNNPILYSSYSSPSYVISLFIYNPYITLLLPSNVPLKIFICPSSDSKRLSVPIDLNPFPEVNNVFNSPSYPYCP